MKVSGFTIARNAIKFNYPILESINSILPICDEFVVNVGDSEDGTLDLIKSIKNPKIRIVETVWDFSQGKEVLSQQTNIALVECKGDWAFYLQTDEVIHENDLPRLRNVMQQYVDDKSVDALRFKWLHFFGSYYRYRIDYGWYQKQDRIIRNNKEVESYGDAYAFRRKDGQPLRQKHTNCFLYHYGWVHPEDVMMRRVKNAMEIGFAAANSQVEESAYKYGDLNRFPIYFGTHPKVMSEKVERHSLSQKDSQNIKARHWWNPLYFLKVRYKTGKRLKYKIE